MHEPMRTRRTAFTLVELLVVIAIISVLAGLLMPVLETAREAAYAASCANRVRQIDAALQYYADDWEDVLPTLWGQASPYWDSWFDQARAYLNERDVEAEAYKDLFGCPSDETFSYHYAHVSYGYDAGAFGGILGSDPVHRRAEFRTPSRKVLLGGTASETYTNPDGGFGSYYGFSLDPGNYGWYMMGSLHDDGATIGWLDGHVNRVPYGDLTSDN